MAVYFKWSINSFKG